MCQAKIYKLIEKQKGWVSVQFIIQKTKLNKNNINHSLRAMIKYDELKRRQGIFKKEVRISGTNCIIGFKMFEYKINK